MIDFPRMVSVSHQNAQMYFDRDVECIFKFFRRRFNLSFQETRDGDDSSDVDAHESGGFSFSSISKTAGFLDKELAASGFTRKDQDDIEKFIGGNEKDSDDEGSDDVNASELNETNVNGVDSLHLLEQNVICEKPTSSSKEESVSEEKCQDCEAGKEIEPNGHLSDEPLYFHSWRIIIRLQMKMTRNS